MNITDTSRQTRPPKETIRAPFDSEMARVEGWFLGLKEGATGGDQASEPPTSLADISEVWLRIGGAGPIRHTYRGLESGIKNEDPEQRGIKSLYLKLTGQVRLRRGTADVKRIVAFMLRNWKWDEERGRDKPFDDLDPDAINLLAEKVEEALFGGEKYLVVDRRGRDAAKTFFEMVAHDYRALFLGHRTRLFSEEGVVGQPVPSDEFLNYFVKIMLVPFVKEGASIFFVVDAGWCGTGDRGWKHEDHDGRVKRFMNVERLRLFLRAAHEFGDDIRGESAVQPGFATWRTLDDRSAGDRTRDGGNGVKIRDFLAERVFVVVLNVSCLHPDGAESHRSVRPRACDDSWFAPELVLPADVPAVWAKDKKTMVALFGPRRLELSEGVRILATVGKGGGEKDAPSITWWVQETSPGAKRIPKEKLKGMDPYTPAKLPSPGAEFEEALRVVFFAAMSLGRSEPSDPGIKAGAILNAKDIRVLSAKDFCIDRLESDQQTLEEN